ncbi:MAG: hypothetical protein CBB68_15465 [Rhodospirillaceae bacterium TMED8]|nr:hypothetical protein [Magnetovibrio sp.]OUT47820.1 MAG: hypothetical protein CBB68_15465 [Rhodospirillaceae bacterium TMED8]|tara:strand:+ start:3959 stop:4153 length:195 start_codon:yes stop_codon:yes gene_type:complete
MEFKLHHNISFAKQFCYMFAITLLLTFGTCVHATNTDTWLELAEVKEKKKPTSDDDDDDDDEGC